MGPKGIVYILTNKYNSTLYTGVTRNLRRRLAEHKLHLNQGFSDRYNTEKLVYYEVYDRLDVGIHREKQLKKWHREWKEDLINGFNPEWKDLAEDIGVDADYIKAVKEAYDERKSVEAGEIGKNDEIAEIAGQARDEGRDAAHGVSQYEGKEEDARLLSGLLNSYKPTDSNNS